MSGVRALTVAALLLVISFVIVDARDRLTGPGPFLVYYLLPAAALVAALASRRLPLRIRTNLSVGWVALVLAAYGAEMSIRMFVPWEEWDRTFPECDRRTFEDNGGSRAIISVRACNKAVAAGLPFDRRSRLEVITDLRQSGVDAWPGVLPGLLSRRRVRVELPDGPAAPLGGISRVSRVFCRQTGAWVVYESDEHGFRNPAGLHGAPADVALLGDSFTEGMCVADGETFADGIRRVYPRTVNLGYTGNGPLLALASLIEYAAPLQPRHVVWFFFEGNDLTDLEVGKRDPILFGYLGGEHHRLTEQQVEVDLALRSFAEAERERELANQAAWEAPVVTVPREPSAATTGPADRGAGILLMRATRRLLERARTNGFQRDGPTFLDGRGLPFDQEMFRTILLESKRWVESWGGTYHVVHLPDWRSVIEGRPAHPQHDLIMETFTDAGVPGLSVLPVLAAHEDPLRLFDLTGHYTAEAQQAIAEEVLRSLELDSLD